MHQSTTPRRAVLYSRVSSQGQADTGVSIEMQEAMARERCQREGWEFVGIFTDVMSGTKDARPELLRLESEAKQKRFQIVIVYKTDRLARSLLKLLTIAGQFSDLGIMLVSLTEPIDFSTELGKLNMAFLGIAGQMEAQNASVRVRDALRLMAARGDHPGNPPPLGYRFTEGNKGLEVNPDEAPIALAVFETYLAERTYRAAAASLNRAGYRTKRGGSFNASAVRTIITNPAYRGAMVWGRFRTVKNSKGQRRIVPEPPEKWVVREDAIPAIVSRETWDRAQAIAEGNKGKHPRLLHGQKHHAWSGLIRCVGCGRAAAVSISMGYRRKSDGERKPQVAYECSTKRNHGKELCASPCHLSGFYLDQYAVPRILAAIGQPAGKRKTKAAQPRREGPDPAKEIAALKAKAARAWEAWVAGAPGWDLARRDAVCKEADEAIARLQETPGADPMPAIRLPSLMALQEIWAAGTERVRGDLLRLYLDRAEADREHLTIHFKDRLGIPPLTLDRPNMRGAYGKSIKGRKLSEVRPPIVR